MYTQSHKWKWFNRKSFRCVLLLSHLHGWNFAWIMMWYSLWPVLTKSTKSAGSTIKLDTIIDYFFKPIYFSLSKAVLVTRKLNNFSLLFSVRKCNFPNEKHFLSQINIARHNCTLYCDKTTFRFGYKIITHIKRIQCNKKRMCFWYGVVWYDISST